jgi:hypothetical protein
LPVSGVAKLSGSGLAELSRVGSGVAEPSGVADSRRAVARLGFHLAELCGLPRLMMEVAGVVVSRKHDKTE